MKTAKPKTSRLTSAATRVATGIKALGYTQVTVDLEGYRRGSMNIGFKTASQKV